MKKDEAMKLAVDKSRVVIEYIENILSDSVKVTGTLDFNSAKIGNETMCTLDIYVPEKSFERHINMGITKDHVDVYYNQLFSDFIDKFLGHETMGLSRYYEVKSNMGQSFHGMSGMNSIGSKIDLNFLCRGMNFSDITKSYNEKINEYLERQKNNSHDDENSKKM